MSSSVKKIIAALSFFGSAFFFIKDVKAQTYEAGIFTGLGLYKGEISTLPNPVNLGVNIQAIGRYNIDHYSTIRINFSNGILTANDKYNTSSLSNRRNTNFKTNLGEFSFIYEHNFFPYRKTKELIPTTPYIFGGLGIAGMNASGGIQSSSSIITPVIPFGIGTKTMITKHLNLNFEFGTRKTFTDLIDNTSDEINGTQVGIKNTYDWYSFFSIGLTYTFYTIMCPQPIN